MRCPACADKRMESAGRLSVLRTRDLGQAVERDRGCPLCGHKLVTVEREAAFYERLLVEAEGLRARVSQLEGELSSAAPSEPERVGSGIPRFQRGCW